MKSLIMGLSGVTAAGTGVMGYYVYRSFSKEEIIKDKISPLKLISSLNLSADDMNKQWQEEFTLDKEEIKKIITSIANEDQGGKELLKWCNESLSKPSSEPLVSNVKKWCTLGTIENRISRSKDKELISASDESGWTSIYDTHQTSDTRAKISLSGAKSDLPNNKDSDLQIIKSFCNKNKIKTFLASEKEEVYNLVIQWCTKTKASNTVDQPT